MDFLDLNVGIRSDSDRRLNSFKGIPDIRFLLIAADQEAYSRVVCRQFYQVINQINIVIEFPREFGLEWYDLQLYDDVAVEWNMEEEHYWRWILTNLEFLAQAERVL